MQPTNYLNNHRKTTNSTSKRREQQKQQEQQPKQLGMSNLATAVMMLNIVYFVLFFYYLVHAYLAIRNQDDETQAIQQRTNFEAGPIQVPWLYYYSVSVVAYSCGIIGSCNKSYILLCVVTIWFVLGCARNIMMNIGNILGILFDCFIGFFTINPHLMLIREIYEESQYEQQNDSTSSTPYSFM